MSVTLHRLQARALYGRGRRQENAAAYLRAFERAVMSRRQQRREVEHVMTSETSGSGRGTVTRAASSVNGTEVRGSERWSATPQGRHDGSYQTARVPVWYLSLIDASGIGRDARTAALSGFKRTTVTPERERKASPRHRQASAADQRTARLLHTAGVIRMGEQD